MFYSLTIPKRVNNTGGVALDGLIIFYSQIWLFEIMILQGQGRNRRFKIRTSVVRRIQAAAYCCGSIIKHGI